MLGLSAPSRIVRHIVLRMDQVDSVSTVYLCVVGQGLRPNEAEACCVLEKQCSIAVHGGYLDFACLNCRTSRSYAMVNDAQRSLQAIKILGRDDGDKT